MDGSLYEFERLPRVAFDGARTRDPAPHRPYAKGSALVGVIRNPLSHRNRGLDPDLADDPNVLTETPRTREELGVVLNRFAERGIGLLVVDGGDGTMRDILTCGISVFGRNWPRLLVLPKGKTNALAADLGLPNRWEAADALAAARRGRVVERRPIIVEHAAPGGGKVLGFILGAGVFTTAISAGQTAHRYGAFNRLAVGIIALVGIVQGLFGFGRSKWRQLSAMRYFADGRSVEVARSGHGKDGTRFALLVSTLTTFPLGMRPFGKCEEGLKFVIIDAPLRRVVAMLPALMGGLDRSVFAKLGVHRGTSEDAILELDDKFILDGEAFPAGQYRLGLGPTMQFIVP